MFSHLRVNAFTGIRLLFCHCRLSASSLISVVLPYVHILYATCARMSLPVRCLFINIYANGYCLWDVYSVGFGGLRLSVYPLIRAETFQQCVEALTNAYDVLV